jgi:hypothetical protein
VELEKKIIFLLERHHLLNENCNFNLYQDKEQIVVCYFLVGLTPPSIETCDLPD